MATLEEEFAGDVSAIAQAWTKGGEEQHVEFHNADDTKARVVGGCFIWVICLLFRRLEGKGFSQTSK
jgi:hypothetical protein